MISKIRNTLLYYAAPMSKAQRFRFLGLVVILLILGWYVVVQRPLHKKLIFYKQKNQCPLLEKSSEGSFDVSVLHKKHVHEIEQVKKSLPADNALDALSLILSHARQIGFEFESLTTDLERTCSCYTKVPIRMRFCAPYQHVGSFLSKISDFPDLFSFKSFSIESDSEKKGYVFCSCLIYVYIL